MIIKGINTNLSVSERKSNYYKKFKKTSTNSLKLESGDLALKISPFDNYYLFVLYGDSDDGDRPLDLSNVGDLYITFIDNNDREIKIKNWTNVEDIDMSNGEVLFKISKTDAQKIRSLSNKNFYISSKLTSNDRSFDESMLYSGRFDDSANSAQKSIAEEIQRQREVWVSELASIEQKLSDALLDVERLTQLNTDQAILIKSLTTSNEELLTQLDKLSKVSNNQTTKKVAKNAEESLRSARLNKDSVQITNTSPQKEPNWKSLIKTQQKYTLD